MATQLLNNYLLKAIDAYPYELEEAVENLNYALSYDDNNTYALFLMGRLQAEQLADYEKAKQYYADAIASNINFTKVYPHYILVLLWNEDYVEAQKLIDFAFTIKGLNKGEVWLAQAQLHENLQAYKKALKAIKKAKIYGYNSDFIYYVEQEEIRIKKKIKPKKNKKKKKGKSKKKKS